MPKVGKKEFPYTAKGMAMAKAEAKKTGKKVAKKSAKKKIVKRGIFNNKRGM
jgi:ribosomal protein L18